MEYSSITLVGECDVNTQSQEENKTEQFRAGSGAVIKVIFYHFQSPSSTPAAFYIKHFI